MPEYATTALCTFCNSRLCLPALELSSKRMSSRGLRLGIAGRRTLNWRGQAAAPSSPAADFNVSSSSLSSTTSSPLARLKVSPSLPSHRQSYPVCCDLEKVLSSKLWSFLPPVPPSQPDWDRLPSTLQPTTLRICLFPNLVTRVHFRDELLRAPATSYLPHASKTRSDSIQFHPPVAQDSQRGTAQGARPHRLRHFKLR